MTDFRSSLSIQSSISLDSSDIQPCESESSLDRVPLSQSCFTSLSSSSKPYSSNSSSDSSEVSTDSADVVSYGITSSSMENAYRVVDL
jgi:hypothetical protein